MLLLFACVFALVTWYVAEKVDQRLNRRDYEEWMGLTRNDGGYFLRSPLTKLGVAEIGEDTNGDGKPENWGVHVDIGEESPLAAHYYLTDLDGDGIPDKGVFTIGEKADGLGRASYVMRDENKDKIVESVNFVLGNLARANDYYSYYDLDADGFADAVAHLSDDEGPEYQWVIQDYRFIKATGIDLLRQSAKVYSNRRGWVSIVFRDGSWHENEQKSIEKED